MQRLTFPATIIAALLALGLPAAQAATAEAFARAEATLSVAAPDSVSVVYSLSEPPAINTVTAEGSGSATNLRTTRTDDVLKLGTESNAISGRADGQANVVAFVIGFADLTNTGTEAAEVTLTLDWLLSIRILADRTLDRAFSFSSVVFYRQNPFDTLFSQGLDFGGQGQIFSEGQLSESIDFGTSLNPGQSLSLGLQIGANTFTTSVIPLPAGLWLLLTGLAGLAVLRRRAA